jgi:hypothetical protein
MYELFCLLFAFICGFLLDVIWTKLVICVQRNKKVSSANLSVGLYLCTIVSTIFIINGNVGAVILYAIGSWLGTYITVKNNV